MVVQENVNQLHESHCFSNTVTEKSYIYMCMYEYYIELSSLSNYMSLTFNTTEALNKCFICRFFPHQEMYMYLKISL